MVCCSRSELQIIKEYDPMPKNSNGSIKFFLYRWDDGKSGKRSLVKCSVCGSFYLVQSYRLNKFLNQNDTLFEDYYFVNDEKSADFLNRNYTGCQLEKKLIPSFKKVKETI